MLKKSTFYLTAVCILAIPRIVRYSYPEIFVEDDFYLQNAFLLSVGEKPYHDFILNHFPVLEIFLKTIFNMFGTSIQTVEVLTQSFVLLNSFLILIIGLLIKDRYAGLAAAFLYACSSLVFRYHVFEREIFTNTCTLLGICCYFSIKKESLLKYALIGFVFFFSATVKFTGAIPLAPIIAVSLYERKLLNAFILLFAFCIPLALTSLFFYERYGYAFYFQVFLFHFLKGSSFLKYRIREFVWSTDVTIFTGIFGLLFYKSSAHTREWLLLKVLFLVYSIFFLFLSSTIWAHNLIDVLPFASLLGGAWLSTISKSIPNLFRDASISAAMRLKQFAFVLFVTVLFFFIKPWITGDAHTEKSFYGFGYIPRAAIIEAAQYIKGHTSSDEAIFCPYPIVAFSSNRKTILNYWENIGVEAWARESVKQAGFLKTREKAVSTDFMELINNTKSFMYECFWKEIEDTKIPLLVRLNPNQSIPFLHIQKMAEDLLKYCSGQKLFEKEYFEIYSFVKKEKIEPYN